MKIQWCVLYQSHNAFCDFMEQYVFIIYSEVTDPLWQWR